MKTATRIAAALAATALTVLSACAHAGGTAGDRLGGGDQALGSASEPTGAGADGTVPVPSVQGLSEHLLGPMDLFILGFPGMVTSDMKGGADRNGAGSRFDVTFLGGDPGCRAGLEPHDVAPASWAWTLMATPTVGTGDFVVVGHEIDAFRSRADAETVMRQDAEQVQSCHAFTGQFPDAPPLAFTHTAIRLRGLGDETVARELVGVSADGGYRFTAALVDVRLGAEVIMFQLIGPRATAQAAEDVAARAVEKLHSDG